MKSPWKNLLKKQRSGAKNSSVQTIVDLVEDKVAKAQKSRGYNHYAEERKRKKRENRVGDQKEFICQDNWKNPLRQIRCIHVWRSN